jgi:hypothetical protein
MVDGDITRWGHRPPPLKKMVNPYKPMKYERSFDDGRNYADCSVRDIQNAFSATKAIIVELDRGMLMRSHNGVLYRKKEGT